jgi:SAM-dependent methyltransferase
VSLLSSPAALRNRDPILGVLRRVLPGRGLVLEVASGSGEHAVHFARALPDLHWQPTDVDPDALASIAARRGEGDAPNLRAPLGLDAAAEAWPVDAADAVVCINLLHIAPWEATEGLLRGAARVLTAGAPLVLYGPYLRRGGGDAPGNVAFDRDLRRRDPRWGVRHLEDVTARAEAHGLGLAEAIEMPARNLTLVLRRA